MPTDTYAHGHADGVLSWHRWRTAANSAGYLLPYLHPGQRLLDVGCGPGTIAVDLARLVAPGQVVGIDREERLLPEARSLAADQGINDATFGQDDGWFAVLNGELLARITP